MRFRLASLCAMSLLGFGATSALAATATGTFTSQLIVTAQCKVQSAANLDFGSHGIIDSTLTTSSAIVVQCTNGQGYTISLDAGLNGTTTTRKMKSGSEYVNYTMWQDSGHSTNWGNSGSEIMTGLTGTGSTQSYTVYGQIIAQATPTAGTYTDTVTVTVTYP